MRVAHRSRVSTADKDEAPGGAAPAAARAPHHARYPDASVFIDRASADTLRDRLEPWLRDAAKTAALESP